VPFITSLFTVNGNASDVTSARSLHFLISLREGEVDPIRWTKEHATLKLVDNGKR